MVVQELVALLGLEVDASTFDRGEKALASLRTGFFAAGAAATAAAAAVFHTVHAMTEAADAAGKMSQRTGVDSTALQELSYAAKLADVSTESLEQSMRFLAKSGVKDVRGRMLELADQMQKLPDDGSRAAFALKNFGKTGTALIPMLKGGREELAALAAEANTLGVVFDKDTIDASERFNDTLTRISYAAGGLRNRLGKVLLPVLQKVADSVLGLIAKIQDNLPTLDQLQKWAKLAAFVLGGVLVAALISAGGAFASLAGAAVAAALRTVLAWAASAAPFLLLAAAVALVLVVLEDIYTFFTGRGKSVTGAFVAYVKSEFGDLQTFLKAFLDWVRTSFSEIGLDIRKKVFGAQMEVVVGEAEARARSSEVRTLGDVLSEKLFGFSRLDGSQGATSGWLEKAFSGLTTPSNLVDNPNFLGIQTPQGFVPKSQLDANGNFTSNITINATPGMSTDELAGKVAEAQESWWDSKMRSTLVGAE